MRTRSNRTADPLGPRRRRRDQAAGGDDAGWGRADGAGRGRGNGWGDEAEPYRNDRSPQGYSSQDRYGSQDRSSRTGRSGGPVYPATGGSPGSEDAPVVRTATGWRVGDEEVSDLTSAMVLADLLAADLPAEGPPTPGTNPPGRGPADARRPGADQSAEVAKLRETVAQLEHALTVRVRVEQAIGVLAERHRLRPRQAFELLRSAARGRGRRVMEVAGEVVDSAANPLLRIPEELAKPPAGRRRGRGHRHMLGRE